MFTLTFLMPRSVPKTSSGKIRRSRVRQMFLTCCLPNAIFSTGWAPSAEFATLSNVSPSAARSSPLSATSPANQLGFPNSEIKGGDASCAIQNASSLEKQSLSRSTDLCCEPTSRTVNAESNAADSYFSAKEPHFDESKQLLLDCVKTVLKQQQLRSTLENEFYGDDDEVEKVIGHSPISKEGKKMRSEEQGATLQTEEFLDFQSIDEDAPLYHLGFDSVTATEFAEALSHRLGRPLDATLIFQYPTLRDLTSYVQQVLDEQSPKSAVKVLSQETATTLLISNVSVTEF